MADLLSYLRMYSFRVTLHSNYKLNAFPVNQVTTLSQNLNVQAAPPPPRKSSANFLHCLPIFLFARTNFAVSHLVLFEF